MRPIDADRLLRNTIYNPSHVPYIAESDIIFAPTVDVPDRNVGEWIYVKKRLARGGYVDASECSVCHKRIMPHLKPNFCPNCGARMKGGDDADN